jgi:hypothetical protein
MVGALNVCDSSICHLEAEYFPEILENHVTLAAIQSDLFDLKTEY